MLVTSRDITGCTIDMGNYIATATSVTWPEADAAALMGGKSHTCMFICELEAFVTQNGSLTLQFNFFSSKCKFPI